MQSRPPLTNQQTEERRKGQPSKLPRFRLVRLEDRVAPKGGGGKPTFTCLANGCGTNLSW